MTLPHAPRAILFDLAVSLALSGLAALLQKKVA